MDKYECLVFTKSVPATDGIDKVGATMNALNSYVQRRPNKTVLHVGVETMVFSDNGKVSSYNVAVFYKQEVY